MFHQQQTHAHADARPMQGSMAEAATTPKPSAMENRIAELIDLQGQVWDRIETLGRRLGPVLMAEDPKASGEGIGTVPSISPLCDELDARIARERYQLLRLDDLIDRLTL